MIVGTDVGFVLGEVTANGWQRSAQPAFSEGSSFIGAGMACLIGPALYYIVLNRRISFEEFATIVASVVVLGSLFALFGSEIVTPILAVLISGVASITIRARRASQAL